MEKFFELIGEGKEDLSYSEMSLRALIIFFITLVYIRVAGRRSFGMGSPFDNVLTILLGGLLARTLVGASPFFETLTATFVVVILHRLIAMLSYYSPAVGKIVKGEERLLYKDGKFYEDNMRRCMMTRHDFEERIREEGLSSADQVEAAYGERNGKMSIVKKK